MAKPISNKLKDLSDELLVSEYQRDKLAVSKIATKYGVSVQAIYYRMRKIGLKRRTNSECHIGLPAWNNKGGSTDSMGYRLVHVNGKQVREHRVIMERIIGGPLRAGEVVHHINGNRSDNRVSNLELHTSHSDHMKEHMTSEEARKRGAKGNETKRKLAALKAVGYEIPK